MSINQLRQSYFFRKQLRDIILLIISLACLLIMSVVLSTKILLVFCNEQQQQANTALHSIELLQQNIRLAQQQTQVIFQVNDNSNVTALFLTCCDRYDLLHQSLKLFAQNNDYPVRQIIVVNDGPTTIELINNLTIFRDIRILVTVQKVGQILAIDMGYRLVKTPYVLYMQDDMFLVKKGLIRMNIEKLQHDPTLIQVWNNKQFHQFILDEEGYVDPEKNSWSGFSLNPTVNRMDLYKQLENGYVGITRNASYGMRAGNVQYLINVFYKQQKYRVWQSQQLLIMHAGSNRVTKQAFTYKENDQAHIFAKEELEKHSALKLKERVQKLQKTQLRKIEDPADSLGQIGKPIQQQVKSQKRQQGRIVQKNVYQNKYTVAIHNIVVMRQNIPFLRQYIAYHSNIGVEKFYIYDNTGSIGKYGSTNTTNKQGFNYAKLVPNSQQQIQAQVNSIVQEFKGQVFIIKWQPKDKDGNIVMEQQKAMYDYIKKYSNNTDYTIFTDQDQYLFSPENRDLKQYLREKQRDGFDRLMLQNKKFAHRYCMQDKRVTQIYDCIQISNYEKHKAWSKKNIIKNRAIIDQIPDSPHEIRTTGKVTWVPMQEFRINHYNTDTGSGNYILQHYDKSEYKKCFDVGMFRYEEYLRSVCENKGRCNTKNLKIIYTDKKNQKKNCQHSIFDNSKL